jgi:hypothetical protein
MAAESEVEQKQRRRRKEKEMGGNPPQCQIRAAPAWAATATDVYVLSAVSTITVR